MSLEGKKKLDNDDLKKISGGHMMWAKTCKICGGIIGNDPDIPDGLRCHCNEDTTPVWGPKPR